VLRADERVEHVLIAPPRVAGRNPTVEVGPVAADIDLGID
jgi:hypothetical protein